jgi:putative ABC transport system permease protein
MILLRLISWPYVRRHLLRTTLTTAGIVLGVAVFVGMNTANRSVLSAFSRTVDRIAGKAQLQVLAGGIGFSEDILERVQAQPCVSVAVPVIEVVVESNMRAQGSLLILGVDLAGDRSLRDYDVDENEEDAIEDPLVFLAQADSIVLARDFASRNGLRVGDHMTFGTAEGVKRFTVRGLMRSGGLASAFGGNLAIMDVYAAQRMFGRGRTFDRLDLVTRDGSSIAACQAEVQAALGPGYQVEPPITRGQHFESMIAGYSAMMNVSSLFALFVGLFIIYNSFGIAVTERRSEIGILRALGATSGRVRWLFVAEGAVMGIVGSAVGLFAGLFLARGLAITVEALVNDLYGMPQSRGEVVVDQALLVLAFGLGVATSVIAALVPARVAAGVDPVQSLQKGKYQAISAAESRRRITLAAVSLVTSLICLAFGRSRWFFYASYLLAIGVALLLTPALTLGLARLLRPILGWLWPVEGVLAADSLSHSPRRTSAVVAALMLSLALVVSFGGIARASYASILGWVQTELDPDLWVMASRDIGIRTIRFPPTMAPELRSIAGIERVQMLREDRVVFRRTPVMVLAVELTGMVETMRLATIEGDLPTMLRELEAGRGLLISENLAQLQQLSRGDILELPAPGGTIRLPIVGVVVDYSDQLGTILMDRALFQRYWHDDSVNFFRVYLEPGAQLADVRRRILERYAGERQVFVLNNDELRRYILRITNQWLGLTYIQVAIAVIVAIFGIVNTLTVSITDRRRELGILRAVGGLHSQIKQTIRIEALSIGVIGIVLGVCLGAINLFYTLEIVRRDLIGMRLDYTYPVTVMLVVVPVMLAAAFVAALWPAQSAVRGPLVQALEYE